MLWWKMIVIVPHLFCALLYALTSLIAVPNWPGQIQSRGVEIEEDMLYLSSAAPIMSRRKENRPHL